MRIINQVGIGIAVLLAMSAVAAYGQQKDTASKADTVVDANGNLHVPDDYRTTYQFLGSWAIAADQSKGSKELEIARLLNSSGRANSTSRKNAHLKSVAARQAPA